MEVAAEKNDSSESKENHKGRNAGKSEASKGERKRGRTNELAGGEKGKATASVRRVTAAVSQLIGGGEGCLNANSLSERREQV